MDESLVHNDSDEQQIGAKRAAADQKANHGDRISNYQIEHKSSIETLNLTTVKRYQHYRPDNLPLE